MFGKFRHKPHKQEDWASDPQNPCKNCMGIASHLPVIPTSECRDLQSMLASEVCHISKLWV